MLLERLIRAQLLGDRAPPLADPAVLGLLSRILASRFEF
jgi:hypothetical protein